MPIVKRMRVLGALQETVTLGTAVSIATSNCNFNAYDIEIQGAIEYHERSSIVGSFSNLSGVIGNQSGTLNFKTELFGSGTPGTSPGWATALLPACGMIETTGTWAPSSLPPVVAATTGNTQTLTMAVYENGLRKQLVGCMGDVKLAYAVGQPIMLEWSFQGVWQAVTTTAMLTPSALPTRKPIKFATATMSIGGTAPACLETFELSLGNELIMRQCAANATGYETALITGRRPVGTWNPESTTPGVAPDDYALWLAGTEEILIVAVTDGTDTVTINAPKAMRMNIQEGERTGIQTDQIEFALNSATGDDEFTIDF